MSRCLNPINIHKGPRLEECNFFQIYYKNMQHAWVTFHKPSETAVMLIMQTVTAVSQYALTAKEIHSDILSKRKPGSVVGLATRYGLEGPGIESRWGEIFRTYPDRLRGPPSLLYNGYRLFPGVKGGRGVMLTTHPLLVPRLRKSCAVPPLTLWVLLGLLRGSLFYS